MNPSRKPFEKLGWEAINGNVQAAKRKAKGYRTKRNLKAIVYLIAGDVLASSPI